MPRQRASSNASDPSLAATDGDETQELGSMYDYLAKIILLGPSGAGKSCLLHRFLRSSFPPLTSQTIGVEFGSKIISIGTPPHRTRLKLQLWDTAGTERFRAVSRSYYRGAAGALLVYDVSRWETFAGLNTFLQDARALGSQKLSVVMVGNKVDVEEEGNPASPVITSEVSEAPDTSSRPSTRARSISTKASGSLLQADSDVWGAEAASFHTATAGPSPIPHSSSANDAEDDDEWDRRTERGISIPPRTPTGPRSNSSNSIPQTPSSAGSLTSTSTIRYVGQQSATRAPHGREVDNATASRWASGQAIPVCMEVSALTGEGVEEAFGRLARMILTKIELGEIDPDDPASGIQYGDRGWWDGDGASGGGFDDGASSRSTVRRRKGKSRTGTGAGLREWEAVFRVEGRGKRRGCC